MPESTITNLVEKLFGSGWAVALLLLSYIALHYQALVPGWALARERQEKDRALADKDKIIAEKNAEIVALWKRIDAATDETRAAMKSLDRAVDGYEMATALASRKVAS